MYHRPGAVLSYWIRRSLVAFKQTWCNAIKEKAKLQVGIKYKDILAANRELQETMSSGRPNIAVLTNITIHPLKEILEYSLRSSGVPADVWVGAYDNVVQDAHKCNEFNVVLLFWELAPIFEQLWSKCEKPDVNLEQTLVAHMIAQVSLVCDKLRSVPLVLFNAFTALRSAWHATKTTAIERVCNKINAHLTAIAPDNCVIVHTDNIIAQLSLAKAIDVRLYYLSRCLYTKEFLTSYVDEVSPSILALFGKVKKALVFDCDNTLWSGIVGEVGVRGIEMSPSTPVGAVFREVQAISRDLALQGVILGICSRNNQEDVTTALEDPEMLLRGEYFAIMKVNWCDKVENLVAIAEELSIGTESILFVDDSPAEIMAVRERLPEIDCLQVPTNIFHYPTEFRRFLRRVAGSLTKEDIRRNEMYRVESVRQMAFRRYASVDEFIRSLGLHIRCHFNACELAARIAQLTQRTNQFNLTNSRYSESNVHDLMADGDATVIGVHVEDRFGSYGVSGVVIIKRDVEAQTAHIETFAVSCRVLGRQVEKAILDAVIRYLQECSTRWLHGRYVRTERNRHAEKYYESAGFSLVWQSAAEKRYKLDLETYKLPMVEYITTEYA